MANNAEVQKNENENTISLIRRFSKRVQGTGLIQATRKRRYYARAKSKLVTRKGALKRLARREEVTELIKLGKMEARVPGARFRRK